jgi:hypothetical protein
MNKKIVFREKEFSEWFSKNFKKFGFSKIIKKNITTSPDYIMLKNGTEVGVELETLASNFVLHKHDIKKIDEVLCLVKDVNLGLPITEVTDLLYKPKNRRVTLSLNFELYKEFQKFCKKNDVIVSKRIERLMEEHIRNGRKEVKA